MKAVLAHRVTADVALLRLAEALPADMVPASLASACRRRPGKPSWWQASASACGAMARSGGTLRSATLVSTGRPGALQLRLTDPATRNQRPGLGACTGDSGAPVFDEADGRRAVIGVVSWSTGPNNEGGCGGLTGVTPLARYRAWIVSEARRLGSPLPP